VKADDLKLWVTYATASIVVLASLFLGVWVWLQPPTEGRDIALIFGFLGTSFGAASTFLFLGEARTAQARATERAVAAATPTSAVQVPAGNDAPVTVSGSNQHIVTEEAVDQ
jgi:hypothetical protein